VPSFSSNSTIGSKHARTTVYTPTNDPDLLDYPSDRLITNTDAGDHTDCSWSSASLASRTACGCGHTAAGGAKGGKNEDEGLWEGCGDMLGQQMPIAFVRSLRKMTYPQSTRPHNPEEEVTVREGNYEGVGWVVHTKLSAVEV